MGMRSDQQALGATLWLRELPPDDIHSLSAARSETHIYGSAESGPSNHTWPALDG